MELFLINLGWMTFNCLLAIFPVILAQIVFKGKFTFLKFLGVIIWFFFFPNTIYLVTDIVNIIYDIKYISGIVLLPDFIMYLVLIPIGVITFVWALSPFEKMFHKQIPIIVLNFLVGFGIVLGRIQRANSWEVVTNPQSVVAKSLEIIKSLDLLIMVLVFAVFSQVIYMRFKKSILKVKF